MVVSVRSKRLDKEVAFLKATAKAYTNIALIKYWGKRDDRLFLPTNSSVSLTLDRFYTETSVEFRSDLPSDQFYLDGKIVNEETEMAKISRFLNLIRDIANEKKFATIQSVNKVPIAAGFASSASGYAALAAAAMKAIGLQTDKKTLSQIARQGSGSACRSVYGGFVEWNKGNREDGSDSFANQILEKEKWDISVLSTLVESQPKEVLSREGMKRTVDTSPFYPGWLATVEQDLAIAKNAIELRDFEMLGEVAERNALKMHATTLGANPPFMYWQSATLQVMEHVQALRASGIQAYFTIDAGPNVKVLCQQKDEQIVYDELKKIPTVKDVYTCHPGPGISYITSND